MIKVEIEGDKEIVSKIQKGSAKMNPMINASIGETAKKAADIMASTAPKKSGKLAKSIKASQVGEMSWAVRSEVDYLAIQRYGTKKKNYIIRPRNKKALWWPGASHPVAYVVHPGIKAKPFVERGVEAANAMIGALINNIGNIFKNLFGG